MWRKVMGFGEYGVSLAELRERQKDRFYPPRVGLLEGKRRKFNIVNIVCSKLSMVDDLVYDCDVVVSCENLVLYNFADKVKLGLEISKYKHSKLAYVSWLEEEPDEEFMVRLQELLPEAVLVPRRMRLFGTGLWGESNWVAVGSPARVFLPGERQVFDSDDKWKEVFGVFAALEVGKS